MVDFDQGRYVQVVAPVPVAVGPVVDAPVIVVRVRAAASGWHKCGAGRCAPKNPSCCPP